jgi:YD repeat-containing protein
MTQHHYRKRSIVGMVGLALCWGVHGQVQDTTTSYSYDNMGNVTEITDPLLKKTVTGYDVLSRQSSIKDPALGVTDLEYDGLDQLTKVTDARRVVTSYQIDGLGNLKQVTSADAGVSSSTYDESGNVLTRTDAKLQTTRYVYDALNRIKLITFHNGTTVAYVYDQGTNALGRLSSITDGSGTIAYSYDQHGRVTMESREITGVTYATSYRYDLDGRLSGMTYPSGRNIQYGRDALGRINSISTDVGGASVALVSQTSYEPFGPVKSVKFGNGQVQTKQHDVDGRVSGFNLSAQAMSLNYDAASRMKGIVNAADPAAATSYGYDSLDRLNSVISTTSSQTYLYDSVGNRKEKVNNSVVTPYKYEGPGNGLTQVGAQVITADANGSITNKGNASFTYDVRGRMVSANTTLGLVQYTINSLGQRVRKVTPTETTIFHYDTAGKLIAETTTVAGVGKTQEHIYLGDMPVAVLK